MAGRRVASTVRQDRVPAGSEIPYWPHRGGPMDFSTQLDDLQQRATDAKSSAQAAVSESREQLRQRIDQAKVDVDLAAKDARQDAQAAAASARSKWTQLKA